MPLIPARLEFAADGTPWSEEFGDVYHSAAGGPAQARHVFLGGNRLPERWAGRERFIILETGFGFGLNFLATWQAWRRDPARCGKLHFVSVEKHPFTLSSLRVLHSRYPEFENEAAQLHACWPMLVPGAHRLELDAGRIVLTLFFSDIKLLRDLRRMRSTWTASRRPGIPTCGRTRCCARSRASRRPVPRRPRGASPRQCARRSNPPASQWRKPPASAIRRKCFSPKMFKR
jgi:tRNA U34 5-methylaminomethyl-2-thiouridine-forming methyltransferase MnmC